MKFWNFYFISVLVIQINLIVLKLAGVISWPWYETMMPTIAMIALIILGAIIYLTSKILRSIAEAWMDSDNAKYARWLAKKNAGRRAQLEPTKSQP